MPSRTARRSGGSGGKKGGGSRRSAPGSTPRARRVTSPTGVSVQFLVSFPFESVSWRRVGWFNSNLAVFWRPFKFLRSILDAWLAVSSIGLVARLLPFSINYCKRWIFNCSLINTFVLIVASRVNKYSADQAVLTKSGFRLNRMVRIFANLSIWTQVEFHSLPCANILLMRGSPWFSENNFASDFYLNFPIFGCSSIGGEREPSSPRLKLLWQDLKLLNF
jgi:hypothetical protein